MCFKNQRLIINGTVAGAYQGASCKLELVDGNRVVTVRFEDNPFRTPKDCVGKTVNPEGGFLFRTGDMKRAGEMVGKIYPGAQKILAGPVSESTGGCSGSTVKYMNYNSIASGIVLL